MPFHNSFFCINDKKSVVPRECRLERSAPIDGLALGLLGDFDLSRSHNLLMNATETSVSYWDLNCMTALYPVSELSSGLSTEMTKLNKLSI